MIHFHISANSIPELHAKIREALGEVKPTADAADRVLTVVENGFNDPDLLNKIIVGLDEATPAEEPKPAEESKPEEQPKEIQSKTYELADVRAAANAYRDKHGIEKLREIFKKHGGEKLKDIPASNYEALMKEIA